MIERDIVTKKIKEFQIKEYMKGELKGVGLSKINIQRTPLGEKIVIFASKPGLIIGGGGSNIKKLTKSIKSQFGLENPQIEISEIDGYEPIASVIAERISNTLERFGPVRFKAIGHKAMSDAINNGARGIEILISGKIPSSRAKVWRFYQGYLKKGGDASKSMVDIAYANAKLKSGVVGVKVSIMPPGTRLPDDIKLLDPEPVVEDITGKADVLEAVDEMTADTNIEETTEENIKDEKN